MQLFIAIALLCQIGGTSSQAPRDVVERRQLICQKEYLKCIREEKILSKEDALSLCVRTRIIKSEKEHRHFKSGSN